MLVDPAVILTSTAFPNTLFPPSFSPSLESLLVLLHFAGFSNLVSGSCHYRVSLDDLEFYLLGFCRGLSFLLLSSRGLGSGARRRERAALQSVLIL